MAKYKQKFKKTKPKKKALFKKIRSDSTINRRTHPRIANSYIDKHGNYKEKPHFANFWKHGFLNDIPTRADYNREIASMYYLVLLDIYFDQLQVWSQEPPSLAALGIY